jgi:hypothetical protein
MLGGGSDGRGDLCVREGGDGGRWDFPEIVFSGNIVCERRRRKAHRGSNSINKIHEIKHLIFPS